ncbi:MAG: hypothetical protein R2706_16715 [Acidimicrobiales bacterium]
MAVRAWVAGVDAYRLGSGGGTNPIEVGPDLFVGSFPADLLPRRRGQVVAAA